MWARSYQVRAVLAVGLLVSFYAVALVMGIGLMSLPVLEVVYLRRIDLKLAFLALVGGGTILWSIIPRGPKWAEPGPRITEADHPRLFALLQEVSRAVGVPMPAEVYLVPEVNAFVTQRGGFLGFGGTRVMGLGVPLLAVQNVSQLKAVVAHEFGHFAGGETRLGALLHATRAGMGRTWENLVRQGSSVLHKPFEWMFRGFMRLTQAISRQQELVADEWAVRVGGKEAHAQALTLSNVHGAGFDFFLQDEVRPLVSVGLSPDNLFEGYRRFTQSSGWREAAPQIEAAARQAQADPWDSHPPLAERLAHAESVQAPPVPADLRPAAELLEKGAELEVRFSDALRPDGARVLSWDELPKAWETLAQRFATRVAARLPGLRWSGLAELAATPASQRAAAEALQPVFVGYQLAGAEQAVRETLTTYLNHWMTSLLLRRGWALEAKPGERLALRRGEQAVEPALALRKLLAGEQTFAELQASLGDGAPEDSAAFVPEEQARKDALEPRAKVTLEDGKKATVVRAPLAELMLPRCCAVCLGPAEELQANFPVKKQSDAHLTLNLAACAEHQKQALKALAAQDYDARTGVVTLHVPDRAYAELIEKCNR